MLKRLLFRIRCRWDCWGCDGGLLSRLVVGREGVGGCFPGGWVSDGWVSRVSPLVRGVGGSLGFGCLSLELWLSSKLCSSSSGGAMQKSFQI